MCTHNFWSFLCFWHNITHWHKGKNNFVLWLINSTAMVCCNLYTFLQIYSASVPSEINCKVGQCSATINSIQEFLLTPISWLLYFHLMYQIAIQKLHYFADRHCQVVQKCCLSQCEERTQITLELCEDDNSRKFYSSLIPGSPRSKAHKTRIINCNQETGTGEVCHQKVQTSEELRQNSNFENICL